jgi:hypothetical protein
LKKEQHGTAQLQIEFVLPLPFGNCVVAVFPLATILDPLVCVEAVAAGEDVDFASGEDTDFRLDCGASFLSPTAF